MHSLFIDYEFQTTVSHICGRFTGSKLYATDSDESIEKIVDDVLHVLKTERESCATFTAFSGYETIDLLRLVKDGQNMVIVTWDRDSSGRIVIAKNRKTAKLDKRQVRKATTEAIRLYNEISAGRE